MDTAPSLLQQQDTGEDSGHSPGVAIEGLCLEAPRRDAASAQKDQTEAGCVLRIVKVQISQGWLLGELG